MSKTKVELDYEFNLNKINNLDLDNNCNKSNVKNAIAKLKNCDNIRVFSSKIEGNNNNENYSEVLWLTGC